MNPILESCFEQAALPYTAVDAIAVTNRPGLVGSLLVGVGAAKAFAYAVEKPLIPVHHLEGHVNSIFLEQKTGSLAFSLTYPLLTALFQGGIRIYMCFKNLHGKENQAIRAIALWGIL